MREREKVDAGKNLLIMAEGAATTTTTTTEGRTPVNIPLVIM